MQSIALRPAPSAPVFPGLPAWLCRLLAARGVETPAQAEAFLHPGWEQLLPPEALPGVAEAAALIRAARDAGQRAVVYGDYDVDGVCASAILAQALRRMGMDTTVYIPDRHEEGYGLNRAAVEKLAGEAALLITVDCGIASVDEVAAAKAAGMQVIVTDHHRPGPALPAADAIVSPLLGGYPFPYLCGAGVAWKLSLALIGPEARDAMDLAALATVADLVSLTGENRAIVALGLPCIQQTRRPGLRALMAEAGMQGKVTSEQVAFQLAPRINACGRLASARIALELLETEDAARARELAAQAQALNQSRKAQEQQVIDAAENQVQQMDLVAIRAIVVCGEGWNSGVVGLAAGRIAEKYAYPTVALSRDGDVCVGSARSAGDVDIYEALGQCQDLFVRFGGHKQAAGLTIPAENVDAFRQRLSQAVGAQTGGRVPSAPIWCDGELALADVTEETVELLSLLEPFGMGNPAPRFLCDSVEALALRPVGQGGKHLKCTFRQNDAMRDGIFFGGGEQALAPGGAYRMAMTPMLNEFRGKVTAQCQLYALELQPETLPPDPEADALAWLGERMEPEAAEPLAADALDALMAGQQGTLLVCRCHETAMRMRSRYPEAAFFLGRAADPRAFHGILLRGCASGACASYRHVVLCDGDFFDAGAWQHACPGATVHALARTAAAKELMARMALDVAALRDCYRLLRSATPRSLEDFAYDQGITPSQGAFALTVLRQIALIDCTLSPFSVSLLPMQKRGPEESLLYQAAH